MFTLHIPLEPMGKERPRSRIAKARDGRQWVSVYTPAKTRKFEADVAVLARSAMRRREIFEGPLTAVIDCIFPVPASWSNAKRMRALAGVIRPTGKPDWDNCGKIVTDAMKGIVLRDDSQIVDGRVRKFYGATPAITVRLRATEIGLLEPVEDAA